MLDLKFIAENPDKVKAAIVNKGVKQIKPEDIDKLIKLYEEKKRLLTETQNLQHQRKAAAQARDLEKGKQLKDKVRDLEEKLSEIETKIYKIWQYVPNLPAADVPIGEDESGNVEVERWGTPKKFDFTPKPHYELLEELGLLDLKRGVKVSGFRGYFLLGDLARLHWAVLTYMLDKLQRKGYTLVIPPTLVFKWAMFGTGHFPWGEDDAYQVSKSGLTVDETGKQEKRTPYLVGTAEVPLIAMFKDETIPYEKLPIRIAGFSPAYRKEVGAHGKEVKGLFRLHEFWKVEQIIIGENNYDLAEQYLKEIRGNQEELLKELELPYRVVHMCTGDMGEPHYRKYDLEVWFPSYNKYREIGSHSIMGQFQARRNNIRYKKEKVKDYVITLNGTGVPSPRILAAIVENYQQKDGSVVVPEVLRPYMLGTDKLRPITLFSW